MASHFFERATRRMPPQGCGSLTESAAHATPAARASASTADERFLRRLGGCFLVFLSG